MKLTNIATALATIAAATLVLPAPASADNITVCPSGTSAVATADTSCAFADSVRKAWYSQPGQIITAYSPVTNQSYKMQCSPVSTSYWIVTKRCVGVNSAGAGLIVYID
jgi:hypothetical protein